MKMLRILCTKLMRSVDCTVSVFHLKYLALCQGFLQA